MSECVTIGDATLYHGNCLDVMQGMYAEFVDSIVTDPPYGLSFMGKDWDHGIPGEHFWAEALRVAKPGAHLLAFGGTRTFHRLACAIEDAGWEIRDCVMWVYGSGFPKSLDVSKAIDKAAGAERDVIGSRRKLGLGGSHTFAQDAWTQAQRGVINLEITAPATDAALQWQGWGTALKPAWEPIIVARKPLIGTVAENVLKHGTGALNIDGSRVPLGETEDAAALEARSGGVRGFQDQYVGGVAKGAPPTDMSKGRWPANLIHDGSDEVVALFPETSSGTLTPDQQLRGGYAGENPNCYGSAARGGTGSYQENAGSAARFFYCAKASKDDRNGLIEGPTRITDDGRNTPIDNPYLRGETLRANHHPTVKPAELMRYLCRLVTPPGGVVFDPFAGSGSTGVAALADSFRFIGCEIEREYLDIARERLNNAQRQVRMFA